MMRNLFSKRILIFIKILIFQFRQLPDSFVYKTWIANQIYIKLTLPIKTWCQTISAEVASGVHHEISAAARGLDQAYSTVYVMRANFSIIWSACAQRENEHAE
jgi:hypothetical protein